jgi:hypothetical protein
VQKDENSNNNAFNSSDDDGGVSSSTSQYSSQNPMTDNTGALNKENMIKIGECECEEDREWYCGNGDITLWHCTELGNGMCRQAFHECQGLDHVEPGQPTKTHKAVCNADGIDGPSCYWEENPLDNPRVEFCDRTGQCMNSGETTYACSEWPRDVGPEEYGWFTDVDCWWQVGDTQHNRAKCGQAQEPFFSEWQEWCGDDDVEEPPTDLDCRDQLNMISEGIGGVDCTCVKQFITCVQTQDCDALNGCAMTAADCAHTCQL